MDRLEVLKKALEKDPNNPLGLYGYAMELYKNKKYNEAIEIFNKYLSLYEDQGAAYRTLAQCYIQIGNLEKAIETYEEGIKKAMKFNHPTMVEEFKQEVEQLKNFL
ncbi:tetratricopeptide repeat protein [Venenivibrio stagnispumantis]|uniref:Anaphase-promoting complex, cyclosome, subunit 3 n=1 Tax=Venenivibrio stagnispumantis TaxID=407998 RepID=A0AA45WJJ5_9AQUI|nr:tetratricopeptide repeat protein [Venenivibrio stagnispumantis]MCW4572424.1 tetratricopeptide repeat protein [Venenivibrio stagnispumantis]SMP03415.1 Anaphase-promoting complex, cyclosome, subunit 3 [Venenivibrio stagnispumantis]